MVRSQSGSGAERFALKSTHTVVLPPSASIWVTSIVLLVIRRKEIVGLLGDLGRRERFGLVGIERGHVAFRGEHRDMPEDVERAQIAEAIVNGREDD